MRDRAHTQQLEGPYARAEKEHEDALSTVVQCMVDTAHGVKLGLGGACKEENGGAVG